jgi:Zn-dependent peptidase ImmA (M78 family)
MPAGTSVPVTPALVEWAINQSGYTLDAVAVAIRVPSETLKAWIRGQAKPNLGELRRLATLLGRPLAAFLLPAPPRELSPSLVEFRGPQKDCRKLHPVELQRLREAARLQRILAWINRELHGPPVSLPQLTTSADPLPAAAETRSRLGITTERQRAWRSSSAALQDLREAIERSGVFVLMLPLGEEACRGFSLWDEHAPLIAVNTAWNAESRAFTLFHEYAHLLTRTPSACLEGPLRRPSSREDPAERWCERFAAAVLLPPEELRRYLIGLGWKPGQTITQWTWPAGRLGISRQACELQH